jgi:hypothetical protein
MNREQRRARERELARRRNQPVAQQLEFKPLTIQYGHDDECVLMAFSDSVRTNRMTIEQAEAMRKGLAEAIDMLKEHKGKGKPGG